MEKPLTTRSLAAGFSWSNANGAPAINPILASLVSVLATLFLWFIGRKSIDAMRSRPNQDLSRLIGMIGEARTDLSPDGTIYVDGEEWSARSEGKIRSGAQVRVLKRDGLILLVELAK